MWISRALGLGAVPGPPHAFAVDEGAVRYGAFPRVAGGLEFREYSEVDLSETTFGAGVLGPTLLEERSLRTGIEDLLGRVSEPPQEASLVVPDSWLRIAFVESGDLPRTSQERDEVLRWKLKQLVPFKVDELRLRAIEVDPLPDQGEERRIMLAFASESLLGHLEASFSSYGVRLGRISNVSLSLLEAAWEAGSRDGLQCVVSLADDSYTVVFAMDGKPVLYRLKSLGKGVESATAEELVRRELRLTRTFVEHQIGPIEKARVFLFGRPEVESQWSSLLTEEMGCPDVRAGSEFLRGDGKAAELEAAQVAPLMGAACTMVA